MANEFKVKNGLIVIGDLTTSGTITINGALAATQSWVTSQAYLTSASLSGYATQSYVTSAISSLIDAAPAALDTLNELAAALGDDANFSTTVTNSIAGKVAKSGDTMTGSLLFANVADNVRLQKGSSFLNLRDSWNNIHLYNAGDGNYIDSNIHYWRSQSADYWMTLNTTGLGIGTTSPSQKLHVNGKAYFVPYTPAVISGGGNPYYGTNITLSADIGSTQGGVRIWGRYGGGTSNAAMTFEIATSDQGYNSDPQLLSYSEYMRLTSAGNLGIGTTTPAALLDVSGALASGKSIIRVTNTDTGNYVTIGAGIPGITNAGMNFTLDGTSRMVVSSGGNVGIGTTSPSYKLDVAGSIRTQDGYIIGANGNADITIDGNIGSQLRYGNQKILLNSADAYIYTNNIARLSITNAGIATFSNNLITTNGIADPGYARITNPGGGISINNDPQSAAIKIALPANGSFTNTMISFTVHIYDYALGKTRTLKIAGYTYFNQDWYNVSVYQSGGELIGNINVRFGVDGGRNCVWIGETSTYWSYPNVFVTDVQCGHSQTANLTSGWNISFVTTLGTVQNTLVAYTNITTKDIGGTTNYVSKFTGANTLGNSLIFDNGTNVGIGTTSPSTKLDVVGGIISTGTYQARMIGGAGGAYFGSMSSIPVIFQVNQAEVARFDESGNLGVGTTSPGSRLHVYTNSDVWHTRIGGASGELRIGGQTPSGAVIQAYTPGGSVRQLYLQRDGGNVGIGNDNPTATLQINGAGGDSAPTLRLISAASDTFNWASDTRYANLTAGETSIHLIGKANSQYNQAYFGYRHVSDGSSSNMLTLGLYASDYLLNILGNGNVGVGTTSPSQKFVVSNGSAEVFKVYSSGEVIVGTNYIYAAASGNSFYSEAAANFRGIIRNDVGAYLQINGGTSGYTYFSGNVGVGTTNPTSPLEITNTGSAGGGYSMYTSGYSAGKLWGMRKYGIDNGQGIHWSSDVQFSSTWYNAIRIGHGQNATNPSFQSYYTTYLATTGGNVGIGSITPQKKLDVNGTGIVASFGGAFSPGAFAGIHFGYSESNSNNDSYKKSALVFERTDNHGQGGNASGKIHFLLNNIATASATSLSHSVMVIDTDSVATQGSARVGIGTTSPSTALTVNGVITATGGNSTNWNTAYGWGNHASVGYLTSLPSHNHDDRYYTESESDAKYLVGTTNPGSVGNFTLSIGNNGSYSYVQSHSGQPLRLNPVGNAVFVDSTLTVSGAVTGSNLSISNWNTAYSWGNHASAGYATTSYVTTQINNLINGAPGVLDTLDELAAALGDDANFATTVTNSIAGKVSKAGDTMTGALTIQNGPSATWDYMTLEHPGPYARINLGNAENGFLIAHEGTTTATFATNGNLTITGALIETSSIKVKENVETSEGNLEKVVNLRPVTYNKIGSQTTELGLIAEEVAEVYPEFVQYDENGEPIGVNYSRLTAALIGAVKQLTKRIETLENNG